tara:strand:+ start:483 stop:1349 length:867 start_codon:yes stop_codon:yes gene_type:complete
VSKLILGTVQMGLDYGINNSYGKISNRQSFEVLSLAFSSGINILDTAEVYGNSHQIIGKFHYNHPNSKFKIITKLPHDIKTHKIESKVFEYLKVLRVEKIETLMFHSFDDFKNNIIAIELLNSLKSDGYINNIGVSVYTNNQIEFLIDKDSIDVVQLPFNLLDNIRVRGELIKKLKESKKIVHSRSAFLQGLFFKKIDENNNIVRELNKELILLNNIKSKLGCTMEELALSYCINQKLIDNVIIGVDSLGHLNANLKATQFKLPSKFKIEIDNINVKNLKLLNPSSWN